MKNQKVRRNFPEARAVNKRERIELGKAFVETEEKKVALSFDAAWGNGQSGYKMKRI